MGELNAMWGAISKELKGANKDVDIGANVKTVDTIQDRLTSNSQNSSPELLLAAIEAAVAIDAAREAKDKASKARSRLQLMMTSNGINSIAMPDRKDIELKKTMSKKLTKGALASILGKETADRVWEKLDKKESTSLDVPKKYEQDEPGGF